MSSEILLSICIPTYNGGKSYLNLVLSKITNIFSGYENVEIIISNNASVDNTRAISEKYVGPQVRYYENRNNIGFNGNMILLTDKYARGEYCWMIGDDDFINPNSVNYLINILETRKYDYISLGNNVVFESQLDSIIYPKTFNFFEASFISALENNCRRENVLGTFMSSYIFRTDKYKAVSKENIVDKFDTFYNVFPNAYISSEAFFESQCAYIHDVVVYSIVHEKTWDNEDNSYRICSNVLTSFFNYLIQKGIRKEDLKRNEDIILYNVICIGTQLLVKKKKVDKIYWKSLLKCFLRPNVFNEIIKSYINKRRYGNSYCCRCL